MWICVSVLLKVRQGRGRPLKDHVDNARKRRQEKNPKEVEQGLLVNMSDDSDGGKHQKRRQRTKKRPTRLMDQRPTKNIIPRTGLVTSVEFFVQSCSNLIEF